jgi:hypothetical protein
MWNLCGRILHYAPLIPTGKFNLNHILKANNFSTDRAALVPIKELLRRQLYFWVVVLKATNGSCTIPLVRAAAPAWAFEYFTDAAGGTMDSPGRGCGGVADGFWFYVPWPRKINAGVKHTDGKKLSRKLSALELVGPLICVAADFKRCKGAAVKIWVDNAGSVKIWEKGYSTSCELCNTLVKAIADVAASAGCQLYISKIRRCSNKGAVAADALSKADFRAFAETKERWRLPVGMAAVPPPILAWLDNPRLDESLGEKVLCHLRSKELVLGYNC